MEKCFKWGGLAQSGRSRSTARILMDPARGSHSSRALPQRRDQMEYTVRPLGMRSTI
jgi:hypothetical protein